MTVSIPDIALPFEIPHMIHPLFVHFAIALPVILLILELINLVAKRRLLTGINFFFMLLIVVVFAGAYLSGVTDAKDINLEAIEAHKQLGVYLVYGSLVVLFFKLISMVIDKIQIKIFFYLALIAFIATSFIEGKRGGELVYKYGVNVQANSTSNQLKTEPNSNKEAIKEAESNKTSTNEPTNSVLNENNHTKAQESNINQTDINITIKQDNQTEHNATENMQESNNTTKESNSTNVAVESNETKATKTEEKNNTKNSEDKIDDINKTNTLDANKTHQEEAPHTAMD